MPIARAEALASARMLWQKACRCSGGSRLHGPFA